MSNAVRWASLAGLFLAQTAFAQTNAIGQWRVTVDAPGIVPYEAQLEIEYRGEDIVAWVENGPAPIKIDGNRIEVRVDARDRQGFRFTRVFIGEFAEDSMEGTVYTEGILETAAEYGEDKSPWSALRTRIIPARDSGKYSLADFHGTWAGVRGRDLRKYSMDLTDKGKAWLDAYDARMDEPQKRCVSPGLVAAVTWIFPFELLVSEDGELTIETSLLAASTRDFNGEPVSENTRIVERYYLSNDGRRLNLEMRMHDPENYNRPPIRRRAWDRNDESLIFPFECDPDSFFRQLYDEGRMQEYIDRSHMRP